MQSAPEVSWLVMKHLDPSEIGEKIHRRSATTKYQWRYCLWAIKWPQWEKISISSMLNRSKSSKWTQHGPKWSTTSRLAILCHFGPFETLTLSGDDNGDDDDQKRVERGEKESRGGGGLTSSASHQFTSYILTSSNHPLRAEIEKISKSTVKSIDSKFSQKHNCNHLWRPEKEKQTIKGQLFDIEKEPSLLPLKLIS